MHNVQLYILKLVIPLYLGIFTNLCVAQFEEVSLYKTTDLPATKITRVRQDNNGVIWFASAEGLFQFDGYRYKQQAFLDNNPNFPLRLIKKIEFDSYGRIWLITKDNTLYYYKIESKILKRVVFTPESKINLVNSMTICNSKLFIGSVRPHYFSIEKTLPEKITPIKIKGNSKGTRLGYNKGNWVYFVLQNQIMIFDAVKNSIIKTIKTPIKASSVCVDSLKNIWLSNGGSFYKYHASLNKWEEIELFKGIKWLEFDNKRNGIWVTTVNRVQFLSLKKEIPEVDFSVLNSNLVVKEESFLDAQDNLWVITQGDLIKINLQERNFKKSIFSEELTEKKIKAIFQDSTQSYWLGTNNSGLFRKDGVTGIVTNYLLDKQINFIQETSNAVFLIGTNKGLYKLEKKPEKQKYEANLIISNKSIGPISCALMTGRSVIWIGNFKGLLRVDVSEKKPEIKKIIRWSDVNNIVYNKEINCLVTSGVNKGLFQVNLDEFHQIKEIKNINQSKELASNSVQMLSKRGQYLWAASSQGISKLIYDIQKEEYVVQKNYTSNNGLTNNFATSIIMQNDSILWVGTRNGLNKFNVISETFTSFYKGYGSNNFSERLISLSKDQNLFFGINQNLNYFNLNNLKLTENQYNIFIEDVEINGIKNKNRKALKNLKHYENNLKISLSIPNYNVPSAIKYRYKIDKPSQDWQIKFASNPVFSLTNLAPGQHKLILQCANEDGKWNSKSTIIEIAIYPPFWRTWWFIIGSILIFTTIIILFIRYFIVKQTRKKEFGLQLSLEKKLREIDQEKIKFFTNVSHDLKTPLTMVKEPIDKVLREQISQSEKQFLLETASKNTGRLISLVNQVLNFSTIQSGALTLNIQRVELIDFVKSIASNFSFKAQQKEIEFIIETKISYLIVFFDKDKIERVIVNLLSNAFKNTPLGGKVIFRINKEQGSKVVNIEIEDTGKGIRKDKLNKIFTRFFQVNTNVQGQGIGLSIVKEYIEAHNGTVAIESEPQKGAKVSISLPVEEGVLEEGVKKSIPVPNNVHENLEYSVLIVEDDDELRNYLSYELAPYYKLLTANNGKYALEIIKEKLPDIILTDVMMPELDGVSLCKKIKEDVRTSHIPVIILTASEGKERKVLEIGANDYIVKPFKTESLILKIKNQLYTISRAKQWFEKEFVLTPEPSNATSPDIIFITKLMKIIESDFIENKLDIAILVSKMGMSKSTLYKKTTQITGQSINELITTIKLKKAADLIVNTNYSFSEITFMLGYNDVKYFRSLFKKKYKVTLSEYRKNPPNEL